MRNGRDLKQYGWLLSKFYTFMVKFSDNGFIMDEFRKRIDSSRKILELGSGPGNDYGVLAEDYDITGSDYSDSFLKTLRKKFPKGSFLKINALTMETEEKYDVIFSNKVLHHLTEDQLSASFKKQYDILNEGGVLFHTMWKGDVRESMTKTKEKSMPDIRYEREDMERLKGRFKIKEFVVYKELKKDDSFFVVMEKSRSEDL